MKTLLLVLSIIVSAQCLTAPTRPYTYKVPRDTFTPSKINANLDTIYNFLPKLVDTLKYNFTQWKHFRNHDSTFKWMNIDTIPSADSIKTTNITSTKSISGSYSGPLTGNVTGNLTGNTFGDSSYNSAAFKAARFRGDLIGNVTGNITGNVTGNVTGKAVLDSCKVAGYGPFTMDSGTAICTLKCSVAGMIYGGSAPVDTIGKLKYYRCGNFVSVLIDEVNVAYNFIDTVFVRNYPAGIIPTDFISVNFPTLRPYTPSGTTVSNLSTVNMECNASATYKMRIRPQETNYTMCIIKNPCFSYLLR